MLAQSKESNFRSASSAQSAVAARMHKRISQLRCLRGYLIPRDAIYLSRQPLSTSTVSMCIYNARAFLIFSGVTGS